MTGRALVIRADAGALPLPDESVDLVVTSPPFWALRSYQDGGRHYDGQLGSESEWPMFLDNLMAVMAEAVRVLKPTGSIFVELGDKYAGSGGHNNAGVSAHGEARGPARYNQNTGGIRPKSLMLLPERFRIRCVDELGLIARATIIWSRLNGLPESVTDRVRRSHTDMVHFTKEGRYFAAVDEVREPQVNGGHVQQSKGAPVASDGTRHRAFAKTPEDYNPLGKLPGSVWPLASEPLITPTWRVVLKGRTVEWFFSWEHACRYARDTVRMFGLSRGRPSIRPEVPHFAAFPTELVRRVILGWSPSGICVECGEGRRPVVTKEQHFNGMGTGWRKSDPTLNKWHEMVDGHPKTTTEATITGYACSCDPRSTNPGSRPAVVLDIFGGTGTTAGVARALGRIGVSVDLSADYSRLANWRIHRSGHFAKVVNRTNRESQGDLFGVPA